MVGEVGLVIKSVDYLDSNKIVTLLTSTGIKTITMRGAQKITNHTFNYAKEFQIIEFEEKSKYLTACKVIKTYSNFYSDYEVTKHVYAILEIIDTLMDHITDYKLAYEFSVAILDGLNEGLNPEILELTFKAKFLYLVGLGPNFNSCVKCGNYSNLKYFSLNDGGCICSNCSNVSDYVVTLDEISTFRLLYLIKLDKLISEIDNIKYDYEKDSLIIDSFYSEFLGFKSKTKKVYKQMHGNMR